jgi:hypothetical protein
LVVDQLVDAYAFGTGRPLTNSDTPDFQIVSSTSSDGLIQITFERPFITGDTHDHEIHVDGQSQLVLWAHGNGGSTYGSLVQHVNKGAVLVNFKTNTAAHVAIPTPQKWTIHGILMVCSLGIVMPLGMAIAKFGRRFQSYWLPAHLISQVSSAVTAIAGIALGYQMTNSANQWRHYRHATIGTTLLALLVVQLFVGATRPHPNTPPRRFWYWVHTAIAMTVFVLSMINLFNGFHIYGVENGLVTAFTVWMIVFIVIFALGSFFQLLKSKSNEVKPTKLSTSE